MTYMSMFIYNLNISKHTDYELMSENITFSSCESLEYTPVMILHCQSTDQPMRYINR